MVKSNILFLNSDVPKIKAFKAAIANLTKNCDFYFQFLALFLFIQI